MRENYSFETIKKEVEKKKETVGKKPLTIEEHEEIEQKP